MKSNNMQFGIRQLLAVILVAAFVFTGLALWKARGDEQKAQVQKLRANDFAVGYKLKPSSVRAKVADKLGIDMVAKPKDLAANSASNVPIPMDDLIAMKSTEHLVFNVTGISDQDLARLDELPNLKHLNLSSTRISDEGISNISDLNLISLHIEKLDITDACTESLAEIKSLKWISVTTGTFSDAAIDTLQKRLPSCKIHLAK